METEVQEADAPIYLEARAPAASSLDMIFDGSSPVPVPEQPVSTGPWAEGAAYVTYTGSNGAYASLG